MDIQAKIILAFTTVLQLGQGVFGGYAALQIMSALFSMSRKNATKKQEGIDHLGWVAGSVVGVILITPLVAWLQAI